MSSPQNMHPEDIKAAIKKTGISLKALALDNDLATDTCRIALHRPLPRANVVIARYLGKRLNQLWPEWYDARGRKTYPKTNLSRKYAEDHTPNAHAA